MDITVVKNDPIYSQRLITSLIVDRELNKHSEQVLWPKQNWKKRLIREKIGTLSQAINFLPKTGSLFLDCFDTIVRRKICPPDAVIMQTCIKASRLLANEGCICSAENVFKLRRKSHNTLGKSLHDRGLDPEPHIAEIWSSICEIIAGRPMPEMAKTLTAIEVETEISFLEMMPGAKDLLLIARERGLKTCVLSDTYYMESQLRVLLASVGLLEYCDFVFSSSEERKNKHSGKLFKHALRTANVTADQVIHIGDNMYSDYRAAKRLGIDALFFVSHAERKRLEKLKSVSGVISRQGLSRHIKFLDNLYPFKFPELNESNRILFDVGFQKAGPAFYSFVDHLINKAHVSGIKDVYFLARDGYVFQQIFDQLVSERKLDMQSHYLHISRKSGCFFDPRTLFARLELDDNWQQSLPETLALIVKRCGAEDVASVPRPEAYGLTYDTKITEVAKTSNFKLWLRDFSANKDVIAAFQEKKTLLFEYLKFTGLSASTNTVAIVDIGWSGSIQNTIHEILSERGYCVPLLGFYFGRGLFSGIESLKVGQCIQQGYIFDSVSHSKPPMHNCAFSFLEILAGAPHGSVKGYVYGPKSIEPTMESIDAKEVISEKIREGIRAFCFWYESARIWEEPEDTFRLAATDLLSYIYDTPTVKEARAFAPIQFDIGWHCGKHRNILGTDHSLLAFIKLALTRKLHPSIWPFGALKIRGFPLWTGKIVLIFLKNIRRAA